MYMAGGSRVANWKSNIIMQFSVFLVGLYTRIQNIIVNTFNRTTEESTEIFFL